MLQMYNSKCFRSLIGILQALYIDVAKVDQDATHVVMVVHVCFKCISVRRVKGLLGLSLLGLISHLLRGQVRHLLYIRRED
jgi:hypothetical protein